MEPESLSVSRRRRTHLAAFSSVDMRPGMPPSSALRSDLSVEDARDIICTLCSTPVHDLLVQQRGLDSGDLPTLLAAALQ